MYAYIKGILEEKGINYIIVENSNIGYKIFMPQTAIDKLDDIGGKVKIYTHYHVREDEISLFGFNSNEQLRMFELLISVSGIGARSALAIISNIEPSNFALAVVSNDTSKLVKIPGIGAKTAARMILELKDKIKAEEAIIKESSEVNAKISENEKVNESISALQVLGYSKRDIEKALEKIDVENLKLEEIIKQGLKYLSR